MFEEIIVKISACLEKHGLPYMIIGGQAVLAYGEPRLTRDIDITLGVNIDHIGKLLSAISEVSLSPVPEDAEAFVHQTMVLPAYDVATGIRVDFIFSFTPYETEAIKRARKITILGQAVCFASPEDVIIHKIFSGRPRDMEDITSILLKNTDLDFQYIRDRLKEFDQAMDRNDFLRAFEHIKDSLK